MSYCFAVLVLSCLAGFIFTYCSGHFAFAKILPLKLILAFVVLTLAIQFQLHQQKSPVMHFQRILLYFFP